MTWVKNLQIEGVKSFVDQTDLTFSRGVNIFVGKNNTGKSTLLQAISSIQNQPGKTLEVSNVSVSKDRGSIVLKVQQGSKESTYDSAYLKAGPVHQNILFSNNRKNNLFYWVSSNRKTSLNDSIDEDATERIDGTHRNLNAKIERLLSLDQAGMPRGKWFMEVCKKVLHFTVVLKRVSSRQEPIFYTNDTTSIRIEDMGDGIANILGLITEMALADEDKIFLIEELENDLHPEAIKALLGLIVESATKRQFFISTHSHIVLQYLGGIADAKIFAVKSEQKEINGHKLFSSGVYEIKSDEERQAILEELGYTLFDFSLYEGWLFLEEASAETFIKEYLIPWFAPSLNGKLRTFSCRGKDSVLRKLNDFNHLLVFIHLTPIYKNKTWVCLDAGADEKEILAAIERTYGDKIAASQWAFHDFEEFYPQTFQSKFQSIKGIQDVEERMKAKTRLLKEVCSWAKANRDIAKEEFQVSAQQVIEKLKEIEQTLCPNSI